MGYAGYSGSLPILSYTQDGGRVCRANFDASDDIYLARLVKVASAAAKTDNDLTLSANANELGVALPATRAGGSTTSATPDNTPYIIVDTQDDLGRVGILPIRPGMTFPAVASTASASTNQAIAIGDLLVRDDTTNHAGTVRPLKSVRTANALSRVVGIAQSAVAQVSTADTAGTAYVSRARIVIVLPHRFGELIRTNATGGEII